VIVKHNLSATKVLRYVAMPLGYATAVAIGVVVLHEISDSKWLVVPFAPIGTLGAAVAIFVAFRNNASYGRWWEARTIWGSIQSNSRVLARQLVASTDNAIAAGSGGTPEEVMAYRRELVLRLVAIVHANTINDIPMLSIATAIERDLREQIGDNELPPSLAPIDGYLW
jgi:ion channel-forming bestrophin family protein